MARVVLNAERISKSIVRVMGVSVNKITIRQVVVQQNAKVHVVGWMVPVSVRMGTGMARVV